MFSRQRRNAYDKYDCLTSWKVEGNNSNYEITCIIDVNTTCAILVFAAHADVWGEERLRVNQRTGTTYTSATARARCRTYGHVT